MLAFGLLAPSLATAQEGGLDQLEEALRQRTEARRAAAALAWKENSAAYLASPGKEAREALAEHAPEIQGPVLASLRQELGAEDPRQSHVDALITLLDSVANAAGADRLASELPRLPVATRLRAIDVIGRNGGLRSVQALEGMLGDRDDELRNASLLALLRIGDAQQCKSWLARVPAADLSSEQRIEVLGLLTKRALPDGFQLPGAWLNLEEPTQAEAVFAFLLAHPDAEVEDPVVEFVFDRNRPLKLRLDGLRVAEHGARDMRWRDAKRQMGVLLRADDGDPIAEDMAWTLHRLGDKAGARFLLDEPEENLKRNRNDWRAHMELGEIQVRLSEFRDAFRSYEDAIRLADVSRGRLQPDDWLYAARAAAGARKEREAGEWLARTRMSPSELRPYRNLPEFADLLDQEPFDRLFGQP